jgi:pilus assembly protein Flp/PilA
MISSKALGSTSDERIQKMRNILMRFVKDEGGATAVEYGILVSLIAAVIITAVGKIGTDVNAAFNTVVTALGG